MTAPSDVHGRCMCGGVRFTAGGELRDVIDCHCERCRRFSGHYVAATAALLDELSIDDAESLLRWFSPAPGASYGFCSRCGSSLFFQSTSDPERRSICAGTLAAPTGLRTTSAWWISQAGDYYDRPQVTELETQ